jgi:hypothetical protein
MICFLFSGTGNNPLYPKTSYTDQRNDTSAAAVRYKAPVFGKNLFQLGTVYKGDSIKLVQIEASSCLPKAEAKHTVAVHENYRYFQKLMIFYFFLIYLCSQFGFFCPVYVVV